MKKLLAFLLSCAMALVCLTGVVLVSAEEKNFDDLTWLKNFTEENRTFISSNHCDLTFNEDGTITCTGTWKMTDEDAGIGEVIDAHIDINYVPLMKKYCTAFTSRREMPNADGSGTYKVIGIKVKGDEHCGNSEQEIFYQDGRSGPLTELWADNGMEGDGSEEWLLFDMELEDGFLERGLGTLRFDWATGEAAPENLGSKITICEIRMFKSAEEAHDVTGVWLLAAEPLPTKAPTEAPVEAPTEAPTEGPDTGAAAPQQTEAPEEKSEDGGCASAFGAGAALLAAAAAALALRRRREEDR